jgi:hypothetical protein
VGWLGEGRQRYIHSVGWPGEGGQRSSSYITLQYVLEGLFFRPCIKLCRQQINAAQGSQIIKLCMSIMYEHYV